MEPLLLSGSANPALAAGVAHALGVAPGACAVERFPDGELHVQLGQDARGRHVFITQPTRPPVGEHLLELVLIADACRRGGAARVTAVMPYFGYARHDRRESGREPLGARVVADLIASGGVGQVIAMDLHTPAVEGCFRIPLVHVTAVPVLAERLRQGTGPRVVVSPDLGAVKLAERYAQALDLPVAVVHKRRLSGSDVAARGVVGVVKGLAPIVVDDMISTGGTIAASIEVLLEAGCAPEVTVAASHGLFVGPAVERLKDLPIRRIVVTDSVPPPAGLPLPLEVASVGPLLAEQVAHLAASTG